MFVMLEKTTAGAHRVTARRADSVLVFVGDSDHPHRIPHELAHYAIERDLALKWGFWGCVAQGALFRGMSVLDGMAEAEAAELSTNVRERAGSRFDTAEVLVAALEEVFAENTDGSFSAGVREKMVERYPVLAAAPLERLDLAGLSTSVNQAADTWSQVKCGDTLTLNWDVPKAA
jgi:hypothetical protein